MSLSISCIKRGVWSWTNRKIKINKIMSQVLRAKKENSKLPLMSKILTCVCTHSWEKIKTLTMGELTTSASAKRRSRGGERHVSKMRNWSIVWIIIDTLKQNWLSEKDPHCGLLCTSLLCIQETRWGQSWWTSEGTFDIFTVSQTICAFLPLTQWLLR